LQEGRIIDDYVNCGGFHCDDNPNFRADAIGAGNDNPEMTSGQIRSELNAVLSNDKSGISNVYSVVADSKLDANTNGTTVGGNFVQVKDSRKNADTGAHEIGYTLGPTHSSNGVMTASATNRRRNNTINTSDLKDMLSYPLRGKVNSENGNKAGKGTVQYFLPFRDYDPQCPSLSSKGKVKKRQ
jgi:hypothetical protein